MATFLTDLWTSVFTPGPTPTLLIATNATFAALQVLLFSLLVYTYSIHFAILSVLCAGLWGSINWFARELQAAQRAQAEAEGSSGRRGDGAGEVGGAGEQTKQRETRRRVGAGGNDTETETETEVEVEGEKTPRRSLRVQRMRSQTPLLDGATGSAVAGAGPQGVRRRMEGSGYISTDSEWEKVEDER